MSKIDPELLSLLACPESRQPLKQASADQLEAINAKISAGGVKNVGGTTVDKPLEAGLMREDGQVIYPVREGIPVLLTEEGISISKS